MKVGLLICDDDPTRDLAEKVQRAADRHEKKYGVVPDVCYVHPSALSDNGKAQKVGEVRVVPRSTVLRDCFWVGVEDLR